MGDTQESYNHDQDVRAMKLSMGNARIELTGHGMDRPWGIFLDKTIRNIKMEVFSYDVDNEQLIRENQHINT